LLGDVHANLPALEAVLQHAKEQGARDIWNSGDFLGYGAYPNEVVQRLREAGAISILGNYDLKVLNFKQKKKKWRNSKLPEKFTAFQWAAKSLTKENRKYLRALPEEQRLSMAGKRVLLTHGSPTSNEEHLYPDTPEERLVALAEIASADVIVCGHSHRHFVRDVGIALYINTGSVGRPDDGDPRACYAILEANPYRLSVRHYRVEYDIQRAVAAIRENELPEAFAQMMLKGYDLDTILQEED